MNLFSFAASSLLFINLELSAMSSFRIPDMIFLRKFSAFQFQCWKIFSCFIPAHTSKFSEAKVIFLSAFPQSLYKIQLAGIYSGFFGWRGSRKCLRGPIFRGWKDMLPLGKALKFGVIFQEYALKLIKNWKILRNFEKNASFSENFLIFGPAIKF